MPERTRHPVPFRSRLGSVARAASALFCVALAAAWVRSYFARDDLDYARPIGLGQRDPFIQHYRCFHCGLVWCEGVIGGSYLIEPLFPDNGPGRFYWNTYPASWKILGADSFWTARGFDFNGEGGWQAGACIFVPFWLPVLLTGAAPAWYLARRLRARRWRFWPGRCPRCGYDVRATSGRCPECGRTVPTPLHARPSIPRAATAGAAAAPAPPAVGGRA